MRLGRLPPDPAAIARAPSLRDHHFAAMPPPQRLDRGDIAYQPRMFGNDILPDCSAAGLANGMLAVGALHGIEVPITDAMVPAFFAECVGVPPTVAAMQATDGARLLDVLWHQARLGFDTGGQTEMVGLPGVLPLTRTALAQTADAHGFAYLGVTMYDRDMQGSGLLDDDGRDPGPMVGDHCLLLWDYLGLADTDTVRVAMWGALWTATWRWVRARLEEAYGVWWRQLTPAGVSPDEADRLRMEWGV